MPFITEEIWHALYDGNPPSKSIALASYPSVIYQRMDPRALNAMILLQEVIRVAREERKNREIPEREFVPMSVIESSNRDFGINPNELISRNADIVQKLAKISTITFHKREELRSAGLNWRNVGFSEIALVHEKQIDIPAERDRHTKDIAKYEKGLAAAERQLGNDAFLQKAPPQVVEGLKKQESETRLLLEKARAALANLPSSGAQGEP
jgi:valyl-tRNA synthetase